MCDEKLNVEGVDVLVLSFFLEFTFMFIFFLLMSRYLDLDASVTSVHDPGKTPFFL